MGRSPASNCNIQISFSLAHESVSPLKSDPLHFIVFLSKCTVQNKCLANLLCPKLPYIEKLTNFFCSSRSPQTAHSKLTILKIRCAHFRFSAHCTGRQKLWRVEKHQCNSTLALWLTTASVYTICKAYGFIACQVFQWTCTLSHWSTSKSLVESCTLLI